MSREIRPLARADRAAWEPLYRGYLEFYAVSADPAAIERVFGWLITGTHGLHGLLLVEDDHVVGMAHYRYYPSPLRGTTGLLLDDLFVDPDVRGGGIGRALIERVRGIAEADGHDRVRWLTRDTNAVARRLYDSLAVATPFITYDLMLG